MNPKIKLIICFVIATIVGGVVGLLTSPGDYPWVLKLIIALWFFILFFHHTIVKDQKRQSGASNKDPKKIGEKSENDFMEYKEKIEEINSLNDKSSFEKKYEIIFQSGAEGQKGNLLFDETTAINLSGIENDICLKLFNALEKSWSNSRPKNIGWVPYDDFRESVAVWKKKIQRQKDEDSPNAIVTDETIINAISRINIKIRDGLNLAEGLDLIQNGEPFFWEGNYRFRINLGHIDLKK